MEEGGTVRDLTLLNQRLENLFAKPDQGENHIQVMTVHQAKGLEFDAVIIPQLAGGARSSERDLLVWHEEVSPEGVATLSVAAQPRKGEKTERYEAIRDAQHSKEEHELKRLFYVACTRAKNELYLLGSTRTKKGGSGLYAPGHNSFLGLIWSKVEAEFAGVLRRSPAQRSLFAEEKPAPRTILRRLPADWQSPRYARSVEWQPPFREITASVRKVTYEWVSDVGRHVGIVAHELLKRATDEAWTSEQIHGMTPTIKSELRRLGIQQSDLASASERVIRAVQNTLSSTRGRWILSAHADARSEWPLGGKIGDQMISGTIDRIFRDGDGRLWIIDFKTSEHEGGQIQSFLDEEQRRYSTQLESYAALVARLEPGPIWLGLYFPLLDAWREWAFDETLVVAAN